MNDERYKKAKERVEELRKFYKNVVTYCVINIILIIIDLVTSPGHFWFYWVTIFWGAALLLHAAKVFIFKGKFLGDEWEKKKIKEFMEKDGEPQK